MMEIRSLEKGAQDCRYKTREVMKGTIKTFDRAEAAAHRIKDGSIRTKESAEEAYQAKEDSPSGYAQGRIAGTGRIVLERAGDRLQDVI